MTRIAALMLVLAACDKATVDAFTCTPACPAGMTCAATGCVATVPPDLAVAAHDDLPPAATCSPACSGATPLCSDHLVCVACLQDGDCPAGQLCQALGLSAVCVQGCKDDARCRAQGGSPTASCCGGRCVDTATDARNCGACGQPCAGEHGTAACAAGACASLACDAGWGDCNHDPGDGCEANLVDDAGNCAACGVACDLPHATAGCAGACYVAACQFGWGDCDDMAGTGCETAVLADVNNCGACDNRCPSAPHASVGCQTATCVLTACQGGYSDCDGSEATGCEVHTGTDPTNCGACGNVCDHGQVCTNGACTCPNCNFPNARSSCVANHCALGACLPGFGNCDGNAVNGCETDVRSDGGNCGACGKTCGPNLFCVAGACVVDSCPNPDWLMSNLGGTANDKVHASEILDPIYNATNLLDGDVTTRWVTQDNTNQWVVFDFGAVVTLSGVNIFNQANHTAGAGGKDTTVQTGPAVDGPWTDVTSFTVADQEMSFQEFDFAETRSQYFRLFVANNWGYENYIQFMEVQFYGCN